LLHGHGGSIGVQVLVGSVSEEVLGAAHEATLLVLGWQSANSVKSVLLGSMATRLLTRCDRPMLVVKQDKPDAYSQVLVPIDLRDNATLTIQATQALAPGAQVHVLHAYRADCEGALGRAGVGKKALQRGRHEAKDKAQSHLLGIVSETEQGPLRLLPHLSDEHPVRFTLSAERQFGADLIVMSKRSRSLLEDAILGSTTKQVLLDSQADVLVVPLLPSA
jgi:nucleotide-binding universal stress UspA family protein